MTRVILAAGVAALAITAPAASAPGGKQDRAERSQTQRAQKSQKARGGEARTQRSATVERRGSMRLANMQQPRRERAERTQVRERQPARVQRAERTQVRERPARVQRAERTQVRERPARVQRQERQAQRIQARPERTTRQAQRQAARTDRTTLRAERQANRAERVAVQRERPFGRIDRTTTVNNRPLERAMQREARADIRAANRAEFRAMNNVQVVPIREATTFVGEPLNVIRQRVVLDPMPIRLRSIYADTPNYYYQYGNGYAYRIDRESQLISALLPLFGLGYGIGQPFPAAYSNYYMPTGLQPFYAASAYSNYRYAGCYTYQIDPFTGLIVDAIPTFAYGCGFGQMLPASYSAYNVPYQYRSLYYDTSDYYYRYAPGAIYQVDPTTSLITAVAALLTGGLNVGQPLPIGYSAYNVPLAYRTTYYDTPNNWYRYSDGYIYRVNPVNGLVTDRVVVVV